MINLNNMLLFDESDLFMAGNGLKKNYALPNLGLMLLEGFVPKGEADGFYEKLLRDTPWREYQMPMYDRVVTAPRMIAWYGEAEQAGQSALQWTSELLELRNRVEK
ncbi:MAG: hypothetical protein ACO1N9_04670 [Flavobacterium sp.]